MRIALFFNLPSGGAKRTMFEIIRRLSDHHQIDSYCYSVSNHVFGDIRPFVHKYRVFSIAPLKLLPSPYGRLNPCMRIYNVLLFRKFAKIVSEEIEQGRYDLAFIQPCQVEFAPSCLQFLQSTPTVFYCHEPPRFFYEDMPVRPYDQPELKRRQILNRVDPFPKLYRKIVLSNDRRNIFHANRILVNSRYTAGVFERIYQRNTQVCYMGIDTRSFSPLNLPRENYFLSVGSVTRLKGFDFLINSLGLLPPSLRYPLIIVSNFQVPEERHYLEELASQQGVQLVLHCGVSDEQLIALYNQAILTLYTPLREPFGLVPIEAMACKTPVVTVCDGGVSESILHEKTGLIIERDLDKFASSTKRLIERPKTISEYGENGRYHVLEHWSWEGLFPTVEKIFLETAQDKERNFNGTKV